MCIFQIFYYDSGPLPLTNGFLAVPDRETPFGSKKIFLKTLNEFSKYKKSLGFVFLKLLSVFTTFFGGVVKLSKDTIIELYKNISLEMLSGSQKIEFEKNSDLAPHISFKVRHSILSNLEKKDKYNAEYNILQKRKHKKLKILTFLQLYRMHKR